MIRNQKRTSSVINNIKIIPISYLSIYFYIYLTLNDQKSLFFFSYILFSTLFLHTSWYLIWYQKVEFFTFTKGRDIMKFLDWVLSGKGSSYFILFNKFDFMDSTNLTYCHELKRRVVLFEPSCYLQPIMCFNIITRSKRYSLFPILSSLIGPSLCNFRITL